MIIIGMSAGHDRGAVLIKDGNVLIGITQSRLSRIKGDGGKFRQGGEGLPLDSINYCLDHYGLKYDDVDLYVYSSTESFDSMEDQFESHLNLPLSKLTFIPHHLAHAFSTFYSSGFSEAAVIVADAMGNLLEETNSFGRRTKDWYPNVNLPLLAEGESWGESISIYHFKLKEYTEVYKKWQKFPHPWNSGEEGSLGTMYGNGSFQLVYTEHDNDWPAGKLMGLSSYADENFINSHEILVKETEDGISVPLLTIYPEVNYKSDFYSKSNVAGLYQREQEQASMILTRLAKRLTDSPNVCVAGGSFLNCNSNEMIVKSGLFSDCYFVPPADDSGIPLGCAFYGHQLLSDNVTNNFLSPYLGKIYGNGEIINSINQFDNLTYTYFENYDDLIEIVSNMISDNKVIGWMQGGSEIGPRALGNRSILASPIEPWMEKNVNSLKGREWFRPFAPAVMFEHQKDIFELDTYSPYMLITTKVKEEWRNKIPSVTHIDHTSRYQSVTKESNPRFYELLLKFKEITGVPVILNTSFNGPSEPIVETPYDALKTFTERKLDALIINDFLILQNH
jgi:carbamoyltransferase